MSDHRTTLARIALALYAMLALVPAAGLVVCLDGANAHIGIGLHDGCPCPVDHDDEHPPCLDVELDGQRDLLPEAASPAQHVPTAWLAIAAATLLHTIPGDAPAGTYARAGPPGGPSDEPPHLARALRARAAVVLLI